jgi:uncharacterized linocin/CFP29 family protein
MSNPRLTWDEGRVNTAVHDAAKEVRIVRPLLKLQGSQGAYVGNIVGHRITLEAAEGTGPQMSIALNQALSPVILSCEFVLRPEQFSDADAINALAVEAACRVAAAEDAVLLLGKNAQEIITRLGVGADPEQLAAQSSLLPAKVSPLPQKHPVLDAIVGAIVELERRGRVGKYAAIVSMDLFQEAMRPRTNTMDAPIHEILPLLVENGFRHSHALPPRTGVLLSLFGDGLKIAVPVDVTVELVEQGKVAILQAVEQIRLVVDIPEAVAALK